MILHEDNEVSTGRSFLNYYIGFTRAYTEINKGIYGGKFDEEGIPLVEIDGIGAVYHPVAIQQYALGALQFYVETGDQKYQNAFSIVTDWLLRNAKRGPNDSFVWTYDYDNPPPNKLKAPWISAMAQGQGISILCRSYLMFEEESNIAAAKKAFNIYLLNVEDGGVRSFDNEGNMWLEEYPTSSPRHVLNGFIFALFGAYDLSFCIPEVRYSTVWEEGLDTIEKVLPMFDLGYWSCYDLLYRKPVKLHYHTQIHIPQLKALYTLSERAIFLEYAKRWKRYAQSPICRIRAELMRKWKGLQSKIF